MAHKTAGGSSRNGRDSAGRRLGIKLFGVEGEKCLEPDESSPTVDFLLQNHPVFFVNDAQDMALAFRDFASWIEAHEDTRAILAAMRKDVSNDVVVKSVRRCHRPGCGKGMLPRIRFSAPGGL